MYKTGDTLGGCRLLQECGSGAFGTVFLAENETTHRHVALKILPKTGHRYEKELVALTVYQEKCSHAGLMRIYHVGQNDDCIFYTMDAADPLNPDGDYVPDTLGNRIRRKKRLEPEEIRTMLNELLDGLEILHNAGLLHRDIKPDNVLWVDGRAVLGDIGLVTASDHASFAGTRGFISPAVWKGERNYSEQDDLYALAMTLYCALTGNEPRGNLELPLSMTWSGCGDLIRAYNAVLDEDSQIHTVADFRTALLKRRNISSGKPRKWMLSAGAVVLLGAVLAFFLLPKAEPGKDVQIQKQTQQIPIPVERQSETAVPVQETSPIQESPVQPRETPSVRKSTDRKNYAEKYGSRKRRDPLDDIALLQKVPSDQELKRREALFIKYSSLVDQVEQAAPIADAIRKDLGKMKDWYLKHQHDYEITSEPDEELLRVYRKAASAAIPQPTSNIQLARLEMRLRTATGAERSRLLEEQRKLTASLDRIRQKRMDELMQDYRTRHAAYLQLSPFKQAAFAYAKQYFNAALLKQSLLVVRHHDYDPEKMKRIYDEWVAAYRKLEGLERKLLPVFNPSELD